LGHIVSKTYKKTGHVSLCYSKMVCIIVLKSTSNISRFP
jgi:hypothetical protein